MRNLILSAALVSASLFGMTAQAAEPLEAGKQYVELSSAIQLHQPFTRLAIQHTVPNTVGRKTTGRRQLRAYPCHVWRDLECSRPIVHHP